jgi:hypothetical protein
MGQPNHGAIASKPDAAVSVPAGPWERWPLVFQVLTPSSQEAGAPALALLARVPTVRAPQLVSVFCHKAPGSDALIGRVGYNRGMRLAES